MKVVLLILACAAIAGCCDYEHHTDVLAATRDPLFYEWLRRNNLVVSNVYPGGECSIIYVRKLGKEFGEVK